MPPSTSPLLFLIPLLSQTAFTTLTVLEPISFQPFTDPSLSSAALRNWFARFVWRGLWVVLACGCVSASAGGRAAWVLGGWQGNGRFYVLGTAFSIGHFLFGPWVCAIDCPIRGVLQFTGTSTMLTCYLIGCQHHRPPCQ
jgi:hypothetical protein